MAKPEVIVIGAGVVGCSLAFHLARAGKKVTVFDKAREVGAGMSARSGALLRMHYTFAPEAELAWKSLRYFVHWEEMVGRDAERRGCGFVRTGFTIVVGPPNVERLRANVAMLRALGGHVVWIKNATNDTRESWSVYHDWLQTPERRDRRYSSMDLAHEGHALWPELDVRPEDATTTVSPVRMRPEATVPA